METKHEEAAGLLVGWPCANLIASETILRNHIFLAAIYMHRKGAFSGGV